MLAQGLPFVDGDVDKALAITITKYEGNTVQMSPARAEVIGIEADEEQGTLGVAASPAVAAVELVVNAEHKTELLGAIASLPALRGMFTETIATTIIESRAGDAEYAKLLKSYQGYETKLADIRSKILEFDESNAPGFNILELVTWSPTEEPEPKTFVVAGARTGGTRSRARSTARSRRSFITVKSILAIWVS